jgi:hypothetical protein
MKGGANNGERGKKTCFNCGGDDHAARDCKAPNSNFKFAVCFTCGETGHLVRDCPTNKQGIYINGGACKICKGTDHLARDCPSKDKCLRCGEKGHISSECPAENSGRYVAPKKIRKENGKGAAGSGARGGDDLDDDFEDALGRKAGDIVPPSVSAKKKPRLDAGDDDDDDSRDAGDEAEGLEWETNDAGERVMTRRTSAKGASTGKKKKRSADDDDAARDTNRKKKTKVVEF